MRQRAIREGLSLVDQGTLKNHVRYLEMMRKVLKMGMRFDCIIVTCDQWMPFSASSKKEIGRILYSCCIRDWQE